jgi:rRNA maturation protein Rpf1
MLKSMCSNGQHKRSLINELTRFFPGSTLLHRFHYAETETGVHYSS